MAVLGLRFCARAFSSCGKRGPLFIAVCGPLTIAASLVAEHRLQTRRLSNCGSQAQLLRGTWDLPRLGLEPVSPALAGRFSTTAPPGKPWMSVFYHMCLLQIFSPSLWLIFSFFDIIFHRAEVFKILMKSNLSTISFMDHVFVLHLKSHYRTQGLLGFLLC